MECRELELIDLNEASRLAWTVFSEFVAPGYAMEGVETFKKIIQPEELQKSFERGNYFMFGCFDEKKLVGLIAMRDISHVTLLFVDKAYHGKGIAKGLFEKALKRSIQEKPGLTEITVNSSPYAVEIYKRLGFKAVGEQTTKDGITYTPMRMDI